MAMELVFDQNPYDSFEFDHVAGLARVTRHRSKPETTEAIDPEDVGPNDKEFKKPRRGEGSLKIDNNYYSKYNEMFHKESEQSNPDSIHYLQYNNICSRRLVFRAPVMFPVTDMAAQGFQMVAPDVYEFSTKYIKILLGTKGAIMTVRSTPYHEFKSHLLATFDLSQHSDKLDTLRAELQLTNLTGAKSFNTLLAEGSSLKFRVDVSSMELECVLSYKLYFGTEMNQFLNPKYVDKIGRVVRGEMELLPSAAEGGADTGSITNGTNASTFYDAMVSNALAQKDVPNFELPELETNLLRFQKRTVDWLLRKESVRYNPTTTRCEPNPLLTPQLIEAITSALTKDVSTEGSDEIESQISTFLNAICFGWQRVRFQGKIFWFNKFNSNLFTNHYVYKYVLNYYQHPETPKLTPGQGHLAEEMGLGKTVEVTALVLLNPIPHSEIDRTINVQLKAHGDLKPVLKAKTTLIIAPDSILKQWVEELLRLAPSLAVTVYKGIGKYPQFDNNARLISDYLRMFDIVFTSYSAISKELDYAVYSSRNNLTRAASRKRRFEDKDEEDEGEEDETGLSVNGDNDNGYANGDSNGYDNGSSNGSNGSSSSSNKPDLFRELFQISLNTQKPKIANQKSETNQTTTDFEQALQTELTLALKHNKLPDIYHNNEYKSPLMFLQFWRVILDEVQMVSSQVSRAFKSAALIPRHHSWGVSGTPIKKNLQDLHSVLSFLKYQPFSRANGKICWDMLTNMNLNTNEDFIKLWSTIGLRHTKAMVHDDIKLPPQRRVLMTIPFNAVEQENYNQILGECLSTICLDTQGNPVLDDWEPTPTILTYMRTWLTRLRQVCCNPQIGNLSNSFRKHRARQNINSGRMVNVVEALKTLDHVLEDMLRSASEEIVTAERKLVQDELDCGQLFEFLLSPERARMHVDAASNYCQEISERTRRMLKQAVNQLNEIRVRSSQKPLPVDDLESGADLSADDDVEDEEATGSKDRPTSMTDNDYRQSQKLEEVINTYRVRLRSLDVMLHKCFFLFASSYFQLYDEEYIEKIKTKTRDWPDFSSPTIERCDTEAITKLLYGEAPLWGWTRKDGVAFSEEYVPLEETVMSYEEQRIDELKHLERCYYAEAEAVRRRLLKGSIANVEKSVKLRIQTREFFTRSGSGSGKDKDELVDDGFLLLPKSTKKFFKQMPVIKISDLEGIIIGIQPKFFLTRVSSLVTLLNHQAIVINRWMNLLIEILCTPLLSFENDPNGEEYEKSIEDQDKASCYLHLINKMLIDRTEAISGKENSTKLVSVQKQQEQRDFDMELGRINDKEFLNALEEERKLVKPNSKSSFQDLLYEIRDIETNLKDEEKIGSSSAHVEMNVLEEMGHRLRNIFDNQKLAQVLFQKEVSVNCNAVFNARIDYFKQLQQISDSVKMPQYNLNIDYLDHDRVEYMLQNYERGSKVTSRELDRSITKYKYLKTLTKEGVEPDDDDYMCIICRSDITIGSLTSCGHKYCKDCLEHWMRTSAQTCPMCKTHVSPFSIYNFTHYRPNLKANTVGVEPTVKKRDENLYSIYQQMDDVAVNDIMQIPLKNSYSSKVDMIVKQVLYLKEKDPKVQIVVFSQWQDLLYILAVAFKNMGISYLASYGTLNSNGGAGRPRSKYDSVEEFKNPDNGITCFLLNAKAQASGLTLINATHIFLCEPLVNTSLELQAISRIHRIGQTKLTTVWMFAIENTVEESIVLLSTNKRLNYLETDENSTPNKISKAKDLSRAESMTLLKSEGIDRLVNRSSGDGETVSNNDLWDAFFCASSSKEMSQTMNLENMSKY